MINTLKKISRTTGRATAILGLAALAVLGSERSGLSEAFPEVMINANNIENIYARTNSYGAEYADYLNELTGKYGRLSTNALAGLTGAAIGYLLTKKKVKGGLN